LPGVASGETILSVAITEPNASWGPGGITLAPSRSNGGDRRGGTKGFVGGATRATHPIGALRPAAPTAGATRPPTTSGAPGGGRGVRARRLAGLLAWQCEVTLDGVEVPADALLGEKQNRGWAALERALLRAWPVLCSYMVGGCQAVFDLSVAHSRERVQFGVP